jgi:hypothetical protein
LFEVVARLQDILNVVLNTDMDIESFATRQQMLDNVMCNLDGALLEKRERDVFLSVREL